MNKKHNRKQDFPKSLKTFFFEDITLSIMHITDIRDKHGSFIRAYISIEQNANLNMLLYMKSTQKNIHDRSHNLNDTKL